MISYTEEYDLPVLTKLVKKDYIAALNTLIELKREVKSSSNICALHYLSWEAENTSFLYDRSDMNAFLYSLRDNDTFLPKSELRRRVSSAYGNQEKFERYKIYAMVVFKHFLDRKVLNVQPFGRTYTVF